MSLLAVLLLVVGLVIACELALRERVRCANRDDDALWNTVAYWGSVQRKPGAELGFRFFAREGSMIWKADHRLNDMGLFSIRSPARERVASEFRILTLGGEQTASSVVEVSWPDLLQDELERRDPGRTYTVFNLAWPDAGPEHYVRYWKEEGEALQPDLVLVNFVETDFYRTLSGAPLSYRGLRVDYANLEYRGYHPDDAVRMSCPVVQGSMVRSLRDPRAIPARPYGVFVNNPRVFEPARMASIQRQMVDDMIEGALPPFGALVLRLISGVDTLVRVRDVRNFDPPPFQPLDKDRMVAFCVDQFSWLAEHVPHVIFTHNFNLTELAAPFELTEMMMACAPHLPVVDMRKAIPADTPPDEIRSWYMVPFMGEKWSDKGHREYAAMMADLVCQWRDSKTIPPRLRIQPEQLAATAS